MLFIAEQDEDGGVAWVWLWRPGFRTAKPLMSRAELPETLDRAEFHGASRDEILAWIESRLA